MEQQKEEKGKVLKQFNKNLGMLTALLNDESLFKPAKMASDDITAAIAELAKEEKEKLLKEFKEGAIAVIQNKRDFDRFASQQKKEMEKKVEEKQKEFNEKVKDLFAKIQDIKRIEQSYYDTLKNASQGVSNPEVDDEAAEE